jgi:anaerobic selenocysteine-containing dehydrogenase
MRNLRIAAAMMLVITLGGCATPLGQKLETFVSAVTTTVNNPVGETDIYRVKNAYAAALELAAEYRTYCWSKPYAVLMADPVSKPICEKRRAIVRAIQKGKGNAKAAIVTAQNFIANNPTLNAASAVSAAWQAVTDFQNAVPVAK